MVIINILQFQCGNTLWTLSHVCRRKIVTSKVVPALTRLMFACNSNWRKRDVLSYYIWDHSDRPTVDLLIIACLNYHDIVFDVNRSNSVKIEAKHLKRGRDVSEMKQVHEQWEQPHDRTRWYLPCTHEESDTMIFVAYIPIMRQKEKALKESWWHKPVTLTFFSQQSVWCQLSKRLVYSSCELHMTKVSTGERWIPVHELCICIGPQKSRGIHAFTNHRSLCCIHLLRQRREDVMYVMR